jgi:hypothetical protein
MKQTIKNLFSALKKEWIFIFILIFYFVAALYNFQAQGLINWDESYLAIVARTYADIFKTMVAHPAALFSSDYFRELRAGYGDTYAVAKPSFVLASSLLSVIWPSQLATRLLSVVSGAAVLIIFYRLLAFYQIEKKIKLAAVFLLASSPLFLIFSRLGLTPIFSALFLLLTLFYLLKFQAGSRTKDIIFSGIFLAVFFLSHYSLFSIAGIILAFGFFYLYQKKSGFKIYSAYAVSFLALPLVWEIITRAGAWLAAKQGMIATGRFGVWPYSQEFLYQLKIGSTGSLATSFSFSDPLYYFRLLWSQEGAVFFFLFLLGLVIFLKRIKRAEYNSVLIAAGIFFIISWAAWQQYPRIIMPIFPLFYLLAAVALAFLYRRASRLSRPLRIALPALICLTIFASHLLAYPDILNIRTPFSDFASYIKKNYAPDKILILTAEPPLWRIYLPGYKIEKMGDSAAWEGAAAGRVILATDDYFNWTVLAGGFIDYSSRRIVREGQTNIFSVPPVVADLVYIKSAVLPQMIKRWQGQPIILYEVDLKKR